MNSSQSENDAHRQATESDDAATDPTPGPRPPDSSTTRRSQLSSDAEPGKGADPVAVAAGVSLGEVTDRLTRQGRDGQFQALDGGVLRCLTCDHQFPASEATATQTSRLEGASDPADLAIVVTLICPQCGTHGALVANYGPEASAAEAEVLTALPREEP